MKMLSKIIIVSLLCACTNVMAQDAIEIFNNAANQVNQNLENLPTTPEGVKNLLGQSVHPAEAYLIRALWAVDDILSSAATFGEAEGGDIYSGASYAYVQKNQVFFVNMESAAASLAENLQGAKEELEKTPHSRGKALGELYKALLDFGQSNQISNGQSSKVILAEDFPTLAISQAAGEETNGDELSELVKIGDCFVTQARDARKEIVREVEEKHETVYEKRQLLFKGGDFESTVQKAAVKWLLSVIRLRTVIAYLEAAGQTDGASHLKTQLKTAVMWGEPFALVDTSSEQDERVFKLLPKWAETYCSN